jgi:hypothetical protein
MHYAAIALAILGWTIGATFRLRFLLGIILLVLVISFVATLFHGSGLWDKALIIVVPQAILQGCYFLGLVSRSFFSFLQRKLTFSKAEPEHLRHPQDG